MIIYIDVKVSCAIWYLNITIKNFDYGYTCTSFSFGIRFVNVVFVLPVI